MTNQPDVAALSLDAITKRFGRVVALSEVSFTLRAGTVHALLGENGAGKSTLMRVAFGLTSPDSGSIRLGGKTLELPSPAAAMSHGIGMVHQHFTLVPAMTVAENVALGGKGRFNHATMAERTRTVAQRAGLSLNPDARVDALSVSAQQRCEIVKALARDIRVLILDEPTAVLAPDEARDLLRWIRAWATGDRSVVLITHKLRDALEIADDITVLRHGTVALSGGARTVGEEAIASAMIGAAPVESSAASDSVPAALEARFAMRNAVIHLEQVDVAAAHGGVVLSNVSFDVRAGEVVGIAAIEGNGQHELLRVLAGRLTPVRGTVTLPASIGFVPEDRHRDALLLDGSLTENVALRDVAAQRGRMRWRALSESTAALLERYDVRTTGPAVLARTLSGGNQQKLVLGRELSANPLALIAENPTRGLDFHATLAVHAAIREARDRGCAVVLYSSDLDEVLAASDRVIVLHGGVVREAPVDRDVVGRLMVGVP